jgi:hypothetical protein
MNRKLQHYVNRLQRRALAPTAEPETAKVLIKIAAELNSLIQQDLIEQIDGLKVKVKEEQK